MNKAELVNAIESKLGGRKPATDALEAVLDVIIREVAKGGKVAITGFGTFQKVAREARTGRNPRTGETVRIRKTTVPRFRPGTSFKNIVADPRKLPKTSPAAARASAGAATKAGVPAKKTATTAKRTTPAKTAATQGRAGQDDSEEDGQGNGGQDRAGEEGVNGQDGSENDHHRQADREEGDELAGRLAQTGQPQPPHDPLVSQNAHPLAGVQRRMPLPASACGCERHPGAVVEHDAPVPVLVARDGRLHSANLRPASRPSAAAVWEPTPSATTAARSAESSTSVRNPGRSSASRRWPKAVCRVAEPGPNAGTMVCG